MSKHRMNTIITGHKPNHNWEWNYLTNSIYTLEEVGGLLLNFFPTCQRTQGPCNDSAAALTDNRYGGVDK